MVNIQYRNKHIKLPPSTPEDGQGGASNDKFGDGAGGGGWSSSGRGSRGGALKGGEGGMGKITKNLNQDHGLVTFCITEGN